MQVFERAFRVRYAECDAYGHVNNAQYLRWMQEAALDASAAVGYSEAALIALGTLWLIRSTEIEYLAALRHNDAITVRTWVEGFRRVWSRRRYEIHRADTLIARAYSDWIYIDVAAQRPVVVPPEMLAAFAPYTAPPGAHPLERDKFPEPPPPPPGAHTWRRSAEWRDLDTAGHVNNAAYLNYLEECGFRAAHALGWPIERMRAENLAIVARKHRIEYVGQARLLDNLDITTYLDEVKRSTAIRHFTVVRVADDGTRELIARARSLFVFINLTTGMPMRLLPDWYASFAPQTAASDKPR